MDTLYYITGNQTKFTAAQRNLRKFDITIEQLAVDVLEIQAKTTEEIAIDKAQKAFAIVKKPLFVSDHGWLITALNGFPGPYMKYVNQWLAPADFIGLMSNHANREVTLRQDVVFTDGTIIKTFTYDLKGEILPEVHGETGANWDRVASITGDGKSIVETRANTGQRTLLDDEPEPWQSFAEWYKEYIK